MTVARDYDIEWWSEPGPTMFSTERFGRLSYTAACPECGEDATWKQTTRATLIGGDWAAYDEPSYEIDCERCRQAVA